MCVFAPNSDAKKEENEKGRKRFSHFERKKAVREGKRKKKSDNFRF